MFRFHQRCAFGEETHPCLLTLLRNIETNEPQAVHRTALTLDGRKVDRKMQGPKLGAAVKLWPQSCARDRLVIGEGIETVLSAALHIKHRGERLDPAWAAIDAGNLKAFPVLRGVKQLIILVRQRRARRARSAGWAGSRDGVLAAMGTRWPASGDLRGKRNWFGF